MGWPSHRRIHDTEAFLQFSADEWARWPAGPYLILSRPDARVRGSTGFSFQSAHEAATGYVLPQDAWGQGFATEALSAMLGIATRIGVSRLVALCYVTFI